MHKNGNQTKKKNKFAICCVNNIIFSNGIFLTRVLVTFYLCCIFAIEKLNKNKKKYHSKKTQKHSDNIGVVLIYVHKILITKLD